MTSIRRWMQKDLMLEDDAPAEPLPPRVRDLGPVNWVGLRTLTAREILRTFKFFWQSLVAPVFSAVLFFLVFSLAMDQGLDKGGAVRMVGGVPFLTFLVPGLVMMSVAQNAFMVGVSLIISKLRGVLVDTLMPPLSPLELTLGYLVGGLFRGLAVGGITLLVLSFLSPLPFAFPGVALYYAVVGSVILGLSGIITGILGDHFEHLGAIQNFVILPATFLSGTFFPISALPHEWQFLCTLNPFFYLIDGFRFGLIGVAGGDLLGGGAILLLIALALFNVTYWLFAHGTRLKT